MIIKGWGWLLILLITIITSCDCYVSVKGQVFSNTNKKPIAGAKVELIGRNISTTTDKNGYFHIGEQTGLCFTPLLKITSENYKPFEMSFKSSNNNKSFELKSDAKVVNYAKPFYPDTTDKETFMIGTSIKIFSESFAFKGDSILFYLDTINPKKEIKDIQEYMKKSI